MFLFLPLFFAEFSGEFYYGNIKSKVWSGSSARSLALAKYFICAAILTLNGGERGRMRLTQYSSVRALTFKRKILHDDDQGEVFLARLPVFLCVLLFFTSAVAKVSYASSNLRRRTAGGLFVADEDLTFCYLNIYLVAFYLCASNFLLLFLKFLFMLA